MFATKFQSAFQSLKKKKSFLTKVSPFICKNIKEVIFARMDTRIAGFDREREGEGGRGKEREGEGGRGREREEEEGRGREREGGLTNP